MPTLTLPRAVLYYAESKTAGTLYPPVVLIHGAGGSHLDWPPDLRRLPGARVITPDLPGHGKSPEPGRQDTLAYAQDVIALLDALEIDQAIIAGHSMGGAIAQQIGLHMPDRVAGLILLGTGSKLPVEPPLPQRIVDETGPTLDWIVDWSWGANAPLDVKALSRERLEAISPVILQGDYLACQSFDVRDRLDAIGAPALVIGSGGDRMVPFKFCVTLAECIPDATLVRLEETGHMFPLENARAVADAITRWLDQHEW